MTAELITAGRVPETRDTTAATMDWCGSALAVVALAAATYALTSLPHTMTPFSWCYVSAVVALTAAVGFIWYERRAADPMVPPSLLRSRPLVAINVVTFFAYGAFGVLSLIFTMTLETVAGYSVQLRPERR